SGKPLLFTVLHMAL
ncbi:hypothetical protein JL09_g7090, partial [Pichia kudriavzevii]